MRLTIKNISAFLMEKGLLQARSIVDGDFMVTQSQNRNAIFRIHIRDDKSLFVKQLVNFDSQNTYFLQKDATCLWLIKNEEAFASLSQYVPEYYGYDPEKQVLIVEYIPDARNVEEVYQANKVLAPELLDQVAKILSSFHFKLEDQTLTNRSVQFFMRQLPWTFQFASATGSYVNHLNTMYGNNPVIDYLKTNEVFLESMRRHVKSYEMTTLIHGDIKWVNFILPNMEDPKTLKIIDWELADIGDPLWDVAGVIQSLFASKVLMSAAANPNPYQVATSISAEYMNQSFMEIKQFWTAYAKYQSFDEVEAEKGLIKALQFAGMRLVQTAFEHNTASQQLQPNAIKLLQISHSLLEHAEAVAQQIHTINQNSHESVKV